MNSKTYLLPLLMLTTSWGVFAGEVDLNKSSVSSKVSVSVKTDSVELQKLDISHLQPGDSETIVTENGRTIDLLRTEDDVEIYIDGKLLDTDTDSMQGTDEKVHYIRKTFEVVCEGDSECEDSVANSRELENVSGAGLHPHARKKIYIIEEEVIIN